MLNDYFARLSLVLSQGEQMNDILVLEPTTTIWLYYSYVMNDPRCMEIGSAFQRIPAFRHHARKGAGGIRPGLGAHHQGPRFGQGR